GRLHHPHRDRGAAAPQQRRHRPDHPGSLPQAGDQDRLRGRPVRRLAQRPGLRAQPAPVRGRDDPGPGPRLRHGFLARARRLGPAELRVPGRHRLALRRHLPRQLRQGGAAGGRRRPEDRRGAVGPRRGPPGGPADRRPAGADDHRRRVLDHLRHRPLHALAPARGSRRHRPDPAPGRRHRHLRAVPAGLQARHPGNLAL
ncbi:MAG: 3-isopropylmalate dehydratase small subunit, partial [uncultured Friedmanniella sp.]